MRVHSIGSISFNVLWLIDYTSLYNYAYVAQSQFPEQDT